MPPKWRVFSFSSWRWLLQQCLPGTRHQFKGTSEESPLRAALLGDEQMEVLGRALAQEHVLHAGSSPELLLARLRSNERSLAEAALNLAKMSGDGLRLHPAGEWLLDNYYLVEEQMRMARQHLPPGYSRQLPRLKGTTPEELPRIYELVQQVIAHGDGRVDVVTLSRFIAAYQTVSSLKLGELWAIPIMLRLALIDNLRRVADGLMRDGRDHILANGWSTLLNATAARQPKEVVLVIADMARSHPPASGAFVAELIRGIQGRGPVLSMASAWVEQWLASEGHSVETLVHNESQRQAADQVSVSNSIGSLRFLDSMDWREFVENMSVVDQVLRKDPAGIYPRMDFQTRDTYRHQVEYLARRSEKEETAVAQATLRLAQRQVPDAQIRSHVGYYLVDAGLPELRTELFGTVSHDTARAGRVKLWTYLLPIAIISVLWTSVLLRATPFANPAVMWYLVCFLALIAATELGIALVNWGATLWVKPKPLPRMDLRQGIPADCRTLVVVPSMLAGREAIEELVSALEVHYLANRDDQLYFALLTDFLDADIILLPGDLDLLEHARLQIEQLNARYAPERQHRFFLLHRPRQWNPAEGSWMGVERKRGKLEALNRLLNAADRRAQAALDFLCVSGNIEGLGQVRYVITLDSDTQLPRDAARALVAAMAHPLNAPRLDATGKIVVAGYGILQPGLGTGMSSGRNSRFARMFGVEPGIDPYTRVVSDVYQDLFGEGSFVGKGIFDVAVFEQVLAGRFPDNRILSHDLLEGCYARAGLISDVRLYEEYPQRYVADIKRRSRWVRGDWQVLPWILPWVPSPAGGYVRTSLSWLSRGKLLDNLRRSLVAPATLALLVIGWVWSPVPIRWTLWLLVLWLLPGFIPALMNLAKVQTGVPLRHHAHRVITDLWRQWLRAGVLLACLLFEAGLHVVAIVRTLFRMLLSHRHLLQWSPSSEVERSLRGGHAEYRLMAGSAGVAVLILAGVAWRQPQALWAALPLTLAWMGAPWLMAWLGHPPSASADALSSEQRAFLGRLSRRTWAFFEVHSTAEHHWLPPDNMQEHPVAVVANRTSPTNIGLSLLANLAAYDLGYLPISAAVKRIADTLATLEMLPRYCGHFFNWYDTQTLEPLLPRYVSSVDSGNLAGHLLTLRQGLLALIDAPVMSMAVFDGLADTFGLLNAQTESSSEASAQAIADFSESLSTIKALQAPRLGEVFDALRLLLAQSERILATSDTPHPVEDEPWAQRLVETCAAALADLQRCASYLATLEATSHDQQQRIPSLHQLMEVGDDPSAQTWAAERIQQLRQLANVAGQLAMMDFQFLYNPTQKLIAIGYNVDERRLDTGHYDLLASEARLGNFVAIAQGQLPQESWFTLGRTMSDAGGEPALLSWSGSMFEYLMPELVMPRYPQTLLDYSMYGAVHAQIRYGAARNVPWGISESGYNSVDTRRNYQYHAFGVPWLGLRRGLGQDLVIAPYASTMALMVEPDAACRNLQRLTALGFGGRFGLYEAIDYTPSRVPRGEDHVVVRSFMSHHQGMALLALDYVLRDAPMQKRFVADPELQATLLLLQERVPQADVLYATRFNEMVERIVPLDDGMPLRIYRNPALPQPALQLLSNGRYHGMLTSAGGGYSKTRDLAVTRWREDASCDQWGTFCYLRDVSTGELWSATHQPTCVPVERYEAIFSDAKAEFKGSHMGYDSHLEIAISAEDDVELRRLHISNRSRHKRVIEITTYAEVVLAPALADEMHPAFSKLFVQTEILNDKQALVCTRRPRAQDEAQPWMLHLVAVHDADIAEISYETDRAMFIGRGRTTRHPSALIEQESLSGAAGSVLDPIVSIRCRIELAPDQQAQVDMVYGVGAEREACISLINKYRDRRLADRVFDLALTQSQVTRRQINASLADAMLYERLAARVLFVDPQLRAEPDVLLQNHRGQAALWSHAISGDLPIVLLRVTDADNDNMNLVRQMVQAHAYWRLKGLRVDLVIWNESQSGYRQELQDNIVGLISSDPEANVLDRPGGIFVRAIEHMPQADRILLQTVARVILSDANGTLAAQLERHATVHSRPPLLVPSTLEDLPDGGVSQDEHVCAEADASELFDNGLGAFTADGREYRIDLEQGVPTPLPWCNVLANDQFGTVVSESSVGYTWAENAHEFRLTPWHNDPISDVSGEAFYLRDEETGHVWSPTALPCPGTGRYQVRHGFGYSVYTHIEQGISSELWVFVDLERPLKYSLLRLKNLSGRVRRLSATGYVEWVLGDIRNKTRLHVVSEVEKGSGVLIASNPYNTDFEGRVAFFDVDAPERSMTADRSDFLGPNGSLATPEAMRRQRLSGRVGASLDACTAIQIPIQLAPGQDFETVFRLGACSGRDEAIAMALQTRGSAVAQAALRAVRAHWLETLETVQVKTPDRAVDLLANGWLLYQTIACRFLARSGYYQSGGAFGFRDQLQDSMAMVHAQPVLVRAHLLRAAKHQFLQGDVLHWWHPPQDRGVRTHCSDDFLWLPQAVCRYLDATGDFPVLGEPLGFIDGRPLRPDEESYYDQPHEAGPLQSLYSHCVLALQRGMSLLGRQGLPLIGSGDWNDGLNRVGKDGKGESVWLGFFLYDTLGRFSEIAARQGDAAFANTCQAHAEQLRTALEQHAWDGHWYRRAWFDDGTPLGSAVSEECRIDSLSQSWAVLSGAGSPGRSQQAMDAMYQQLVDVDAGIIKLLTPPFDVTAHDPGYIRGYVPGVRENGGQYTHAAVWAAMAFAALGDNSRAWQLATMINPVHHALDASTVQQYKTEPYVLSADVYAVAPHVGRGGWSWYTGAAGWMYRLLTESLLGLQRNGDRILLTPCIPADWSGYQMRYRFGTSQYLIDVIQCIGSQSLLELDGVAQPELSFVLVDDGLTHQVLLNWSGASNEHARTTGL